MGSCIEILIAFPNGIGMAQKSHFLEMLGDIVIDVEPEFKKGSELGEYLDSIFYKYKDIIRFSSCTHYYGIGYERGPWLQIYGLLKFIKKYFNKINHDLFYYEDVTNYPEIVSDNDIEQIMDHYVKYGNKPYRDSFID